MSFPPPNSGQYPQYIPHPQYQPGHVPQQQLLYNNVAAPSPSPYIGYGKPPPYAPGMMPYPSAYHQYLQQNQHHMQQPIQSPQLQQSPLILPQQQLPPQPQPPIQPHQPHQQQSPRPRPQQQSPLLPRPQQQSPLISHAQQSPHPRPQQPLIQPQHQSPIIPHAQHQQSPRSRPPQSPIQISQAQQNLSRPVPIQPSPPLQRQPPQPVQPVQQVQQVQPIQPVQQVQQVQPVQTQPVQPVQPVQAVQPVQLQQPPPSLPLAEPQLQFVNPANLFVEPPLPTAPRYRYTPSSQYVDPSALSTPSSTELPPISLPSTSSPSLPQLAPAPSAPPKSPKINSEPVQAISSFQAQPPQPAKVKKEKKAQSAPAPKPASIPKTPDHPKSVPPKSTPTPSAAVVPQVMLLAPSPDFQNRVQKQPSPKKPQLKKPVTQPVLDRQPKPNKPLVDYQVLLLSLADEYLNAAHLMGTQTALLSNHADVEGYYKLVATGLGCLEAVLKNWRLQPRKEALVRLRYARTLFEETENDIEAETALSKGIDLCERNRMLDLKYSMQHLLARMLHKNNPKASLKAVDGMIQDVETYRHAAWEYAFRFLRVSLSMASPSHQDAVQALQHLSKIASMASRNGDKAVSAMAAVIEALAHLQQGTSSDSIEQAQRAVATARSHQLNDELRHIPQLSTLIQMMDICCSLLEYDVNQSSQKLKVMQVLVDETLNDGNWSPDGSFSIPLNGKSAGPSSIDTGDILQVQNGTLLLSFNWLPQHDLYALSYFLSSITLSAKNSYDGRKAEKYLDEGLRMIQGSFKTPQEIPECMVNATRRIEWRRSLYCNFLLQRVFLACSRTDWDMATQSLKDLRQVVHEIGANTSTAIACLMEYAAGTIAQATGDLDTALSIYQSPLLLLSPSSSKTARNNPCRDTCILAALNTVLIIRDPAHPAHSSLANILANLDLFCSVSPNKYIQAAYHLVCATVHTDSTIQTKQYLQQALQSATAISNSQITCMTLTFMSWRYFRGVVGEQAEKSARAGRAMAKRANDRLWASVTDEMLADTLERQGKGDEARGVREEGQRLIMSLPPGLKRPA
ncbi:hypothetical protein N7493_007210 [Penicillium malachiteum]|uniref:75k gamma secalin n=1 Tax=Penicillium malachiteum TaxID=1324776 RepID=A0AAD6HIS7_9EURO|nr:hypothetical protein N7493_007210 [Penicillium malachiteum]